MITVYAHENNAVKVHVMAQDHEWPMDAVWVDVQDPSTDELDTIEKILHITLPDTADVWRNHVLNRLYIEKNTAFMTAALITKVDSPYPSTSPVTFIVTPNVLLTIHDIAPTSFKNFAVRFQKNPAEFPSSLHIFEGLMEEVITRVAYNSELVVETLDQLSHDIFNLTNTEERVDRKTKPVKISQSSTVMQAVLKCLGATADLNSKINESLHSLHRMLVYFKQEVSEDARVDAKVDMLVTDIMALLTQTAFLSDKITFQLDATLGMINVEQNLIIKIFSMVAVFFMPPTLIASLYGMNFEFMPELHMTFGYPIALGLMFMSSAIPYIYFRHRGWL